jgi:hypothetical protein
MLLLPEVFRQDGEREILGITLEYDYDARKKNFAVIALDKTTNVYVLGVAERRGAASRPWHRGAEWCACSVPNDAAYAVDVGYARDVRRMCRHDLLTVKTADQGEHCAMSLWMEMRLGFLERSDN